MQCRGGYIKMSEFFSLGELLLIHDAVYRLPKGCKLFAGQMNSGAKFQETTRENLLIKIMEYGEQLEGIHATKTNQCRWFSGDFTSVCTNGDSEYCADFVSGEECDECNHRMYKL